MNGISQQRNLGFGLNAKQLRSFLISPEAKELGVSLKRQIKMVPLTNSEDPVKATVYSLMQGGDVLNLNNGHGVSMPLQETGKNALSRLAQKLQEKCGYIIPGKEDFAARVCFRPLSQTIKENSQKLKAAILRAAGE